MSLITIQNCRIENSKKIIIQNLSWKMEEAQTWLVIGPNGGGKADFLNSLSKNIGLKIIPNNFDNQDSSIFTSAFGDSEEIVSLERAARLIQEERENDESEYVEGGVDIGRTGRMFIAEAICGPIKKNAPLPEIAKKIEAYPAIKLCGIEKILDRGLKYMSTGEIRRTLLARALISGKKLLILSDPFAGLDVQSRKILLDFFNSIAERQNKKENASNSFDFPHIILGMERWHEIPEAVTNVLEFKNQDISFCGLRSDYEVLLKNRETQLSAQKESDKKAFSNALNELTNNNAEENNTAILNNQLYEETCRNQKTCLVEMNNVNVAWGDNHVLQDINWKLYKGEHWLIQGPNGSGKTTFLELITGDNMQVFCNDVRIFGNKRGSGESIWDIKKRLGIVSYRLHVEYRMVGGTSLQNVIISGLKDSIGLYETPTDLEISMAKKWLALGGFAGRENESFGNLSYGEQRAILILRSAVKTPEILILDEPCHGLDEQYREKILDLMNIIGNGGTTTMLHVTHDLSEVLECEKHILHFMPGELPMYKITELL